METLGRIFVVAWLAVAPAALLGICGFVIGTGLGSSDGIIATLALVGMVAGVCIGVWVAGRVDKRRGALWFLTGAAATPDLDTAANIRSLRSGDPERIRHAFRFLVMLGPEGRTARSDVERFIEDPDPETAAGAREALDALDGDEP